MSNAPTALITNRYADEAEVWLDAKSDYDAAKEALDTAKDTLVSVVSVDDGPYVIVTADSGAVALTDKDRRNFDADKLASLTPGRAQYTGSLAKLVEAGVLKLTVDAKAFDKAVEAGLIEAKIVSKVVTNTSFVDVRKVDKPKPA